MRKEYFNKLIEKNILLKNVDRLTFLEFLEHKNKLLYSINNSSRSESTDMPAKANYPLRGITVH